MNTELEIYLNTTPFNHIDDVRNAFEMCCNLSDVNAVIESIPIKFGTFYIDFYNKDTFAIYNEYYEYDTLQDDFENFDWFYGGDSKSKLTEADKMMAYKNYLGGRKCGHPLCSEDFEEFMRDFTGNYPNSNYNMDAILQAFNIEVYGREE